MLLLFIFFISTVCLTVYSIQNNELYPMEKYENTECLILNYTSYIKIVNINVIYLVNEKYIISNIEIADIRNYYKIGFKYSCYYAISNYKSIRFDEPNYGTLIFILFFGIGTLILIIVNILLVIILRKKKNID